MKKMSATAKVLNVFAKIFMIISIVCGSILAVAAVIICFVPSEDFAEMATELTLGGVCFTLAPEAGIVPDNAKWTMLVSVAVMAIMVFIGVYFLRIAKKALKPIAEENPFDEAVYRNIRKLGIMVLVFGVVMQIIGAAVQIAMFSGFDFEKIFINEYITNVRFEVTSDSSYIFVAIVLFLLSGVFKYGAELQQQSDETL